MSAGTTDLLQLLLCALLIIDTVDSSAPVVRTQYGDVEGFQHEINERQSANIFLGVPFASPPVGELRFRQPEPPAKWSGVKKTVDFPRACAQTGSELTMPPAGQGEDCLYLNVFAPAKRASSCQCYTLEVTLENLGENSFKRQDGVGFPIMVWIYGGGFQWGSSFDYGKVGICENFVARDVVVVVAQYRVNIYGFLSTGDSAAPGNWGLWDQVEALRWVKANIANFGGDPNRVTIFGESAGGGSVSYMTLAPVARDLFQQSIAQSGTAHGFWARQYTPRKNAEDYAANAGCIFGETEKLMECLRSKTTEELLDAFNKTLSNLSDPATALLFVPTVDGILIPDIPDKLAETQPPKPAMLGTCKQESLMFVRPPPMMVESTKGEFKGLFVGDDHLTIEVFLSMINATITEALFPNSVDVARNLARFHYVDSRPQDDVNDETFLLWQLIELMSDTWFHVPTFNDAAFKRKVGAPVYLYDFDFINLKFYPDDHKFKGVGHATDLVYEFGIKGTVGELLVDVTKLDENDHKMTDLFCTFLTNFAKYGNPTPQPIEGVVWPIAEPSVDTRALRIALPPNVSSFQRPATAFWADLLPTVERLMAQKKSKSVDDGAEKRDEL